MSIRIESRENSLVKRLVHLSNDRKFRKEMQEMVCEGEKMLGEALSSGMDIHDILLAEDAELDTALLRQAEGQGAKLYICPSSLLGKVSNVKTPQGVVFTCRLPRTECPQTLTGARYLALDGVQDPGNVGTILRTLDAFEADGLVLLPGCADPFSPKTVRSSMGAVPSGAEAKSTPLSSKTSRAAAVITPRATGTEQLMRRLHCSGEGPAQGTAHSTSRASMPPPGNTTASGVKAMVEARRSMKTSTGAASTVSSMGAPPTSGLSKRR